MLKLNLYTINPPKKGLKKTLELKKYSNINYNNDNEEDEKDPKDEKDKKKK